jgi:hypothetical protein
MHSQIVLLRRQNGSILATALLPLLLLVLLFASFGASRKWKIEQPSRATRNQYPVIIPDEIAVCDPVDTAPGVLDDKNKNEPVINN